MKEKIKRDIGAIKHQLAIDEKVTSTELLWRILRMNTEGYDNDLFFRYIYVDNEYITKKANKFLKSLEFSSCPFILLHGFSKNGKTTFYKYVRYVNNQLRDNDSNLNIVQFNFEKSDNYIDKIREFWLKEFDSENFQELLDKFDNFINFYKFYNQFVTDLKSHVRVAEEGEASNELTSYFDNLSDIHFLTLYKFIKSQKEEIINNKNCNQIDRKKYDNDDDNDEVRYYKLLVKEQIKQNIIDENVSEQLSLLFLYKIFQDRYRIFYSKKKQRKFIFLLDNLDDYLKNDDIKFYQYPQFYLSKFVIQITKEPIISSTFSNTLKKFLDVNQDEIFKWNFSFQRNFSLGYAMRTPNFLAFSSIQKELFYNISDSQEKYTPQCMMDINYFRMNSTNFTSDILSKRLNFANELFYVLNRKLPPGYNFLKLLAQIDKHKSDLDKTKSIFSLWNGDKKVFIDNIVNQWYLILSDKYLSHEKEMLDCFHTNHLNSKYLLKGIYIYLFLTLLENNSKAKNKLLNTIFKYKRENKKGKSIRRFMLNYVINESEDKDKPLLIHDIGSKGVGLFELLNSTNDFIKKINKKEGRQIYLSNSIENFIKDSYSEKIDYFAQLLTIYKSQIIDINGVKANTLYYNLDKELDDYKTKSYDYNRERLDEIRLFNNNNAAFITGDLMSHFELFSFSLSHDENCKNLSIKKPLFFSVNKKENIDIIRDVSDFELFDIIEKVYENVDTSINKIVDFYINNIIDSFPPSKFIKNKFLSLFDKELKVGDFQFRLIIRRHISYLDGFRLSILDESIFNLPLNHKKMINSYITNIIIKYIDLYKYNYFKIYNYLFKKTNHIKKKTILDSNYNVLERYRLNAKKVLLDNENNDFNRIIDEI